MDLKQRKRIINKYDSGKTHTGGIGATPQGQPRYLTSLNNWQRGGYYGINPNLNWYNGMQISQPIQGNSITGDQNTHVNIDTSIAPPPQLTPDGTSSSDNTSSSNNTFSGDTDYKSNIGGNIVVNAANFAGQMFSDYNNTGVKNTQELLGDAGISQQYINGIGYQQQNDINYTQQMREINTINEGNAIKSIGSGAALGASVGSIIPGLGTVAGGLIGGAIGGIASIFGAKRKKAQLRKRIYNAQQLANRTNIYNRSSAFSKALQQDYYQNNADTTDGVLYANRGKDLKQPIKK